MSGRSGTATCAQGANPSPIKRGRRLPYCLLAVALLFGAVTLRKDVGAASPATASRSKAQWAQTYATLPLSFEANRGQTDASVNFVSRGQGYALFLTNGEAVLSLKRPATGGANPPLAKGAKAGLAPSRPADSVVRMKLLGANPAAKAQGADELAGKANYFIGNDPSQWHTDVPTYAKVRYAGVYPGVDLVYYGNQGGQLEYDFIVAPGTDPGTIALGIDGLQHRPVTLNPQGNLVVKLEEGNVEFHKPVAYQTVASRRQPVDVRYTLDAQNHVRFDCGAYDHSAPLVVDPVLLYATYVGGNGFDIAYGIAVDSLTHDAYVTGVTSSTNFPTTTTPGIIPYQGTNKGGNGDAFVTQLNAAGNAIVYSTYFGGAGSDTGTAIALSEGNAYVTGYTTSTNLPVKSPAGGGTTPPFQQFYGGNTDAFVFVLTTLGNNLLYSSYLGGNGADFGQGIAVDASKNAYIAGTTQSTNFPIVNALQSINNGGPDAFIAKVNFSGDQLLYSTYLGGSQLDVAQAIALDPSGNIYITGYTASTNFPLVSPMQSTPGGGVDAFVTELNAAGTALTFSTYLGGTADDRAYGIALDNSQNIYVAGATSSADFPTTSGVVQTSLRGTANGFVTALNHGGASAIYSTFLGGSGTDQANSIAVTSAGVAFVTGFTNSSDFPTAAPLQAILGLSNNGLCGSAPCDDAFVSQLNPAGTGLVYSTFLGGSGPDFGQGITVDIDGKPYIAGSTSSTNFPAIAGGSFSSSLTGNSGNAFIAKIDSHSPEVPNLAILPANVAFGNQTITLTSALQKVVLVNPSTATLSITSISVAAVGTSSTVFQESDNCIGNIPGGGGSCTMNVSYTPSQIGVQSTTITVTDNAGGVAGTTQTINLSGTGVTAATAVTVAPTSMSFSSQTVGTTSPPQSALVTNTGTQPLNITNISPGSTDFAETDNCLSQPFNGVLPVGSSCTITVTFSPTASGTRNAALTIADNATGSPQSILLSGVGAAEFTLASPSAVNPVIIGSTQTTFDIVANGPTTGPNAFNGAITLSCSPGVTCTFNPNPIFVGAQTSVMTVSNLTPTPTSNPFPFTVTGTSGSESNTLPISLQFSDFALTASPANVSVAAGSAATYHLNINPLFGFNNLSPSQSVSLIISNISPPLADYTYQFTPQSPTITGAGPTPVTLTIQTTKFLNPTVPTAHSLPTFPGGKLPPALFGLLSLAGLVSLAIGHKRRARSGRLGYGWMAFRLGTLSAILALNLAMAACRPATLATTGTKTGGYVVTIQGTLVSNTSVFRQVVVDLSVTQGTQP